MYEAFIPVFYKCCCLILEYNIMVIKFQEHININCYLSKDAKDAITNTLFITLFSKPNLCEVVYSYYRFVKTQWEYI